MMTGKQFMHAYTQLRHAGAGCAFDSRCSSATIEQAYEMYLTFLGGRKLKPRPMCEFLSYLLYKRGCDHARPPFRDHEQFFSDGVYGSPRVATIQPYLFAVADQEDITDEVVSA